MKVSYNWLQNYFEESLPGPEKISEGIIFHAFEVEDQEETGSDTVFDVKILPDRAHDCLSHFGIAKEISAIFDLEISFPNGFSKIVLSKQPSSLIRSHTIKNNTSLEVKIENDKCLRYMGRIIRNIKIEESPEWLKDKLNSIGQKPINNIVDAANFIMFDLGQPIHLFDLDKLINPKLIIRNGRIGERIITLDKKEVDLDDSILIIADENKPLAIAGIKGGVNAEVDKNTKNIVIEVANFNSIATRKTARKINILTDAVKRYENEISPELCSVSMDEITNLIYSLAGGEIEEIIDIYPKKAEQKVISISVDYINKRLGSSFSKIEIEDVWRKLNFRYTEEGGIFEIQIPFLRLDLLEPHDLTEEVVRILGYSRLEEILPNIKTDKKVNDAFYKMILVRNKLLMDGYSEVMTYVFCDKGKVEVLASASGKNFLRDNLSDGLRESIRLNTLNIPLLDTKEIKIFEIGSVFLKEKEEMRVAYGNKKEINEMTINEFCEKFDLLTNNIVPVENLIKSSLGEKNIFKMWSSYPFILRDIAVWVPKDTMPEKLINIYKEFGTELLVKDPVLFDSFTKDDRTSFAYRLVFQAYDRTLTDDEVNKIIEEITKKITSLGWEVR